MTSETLRPSISELPVTVLERWADALESGKYPQSLHNLQTRDGFCCLGVLSDLYCQDTGDQWDDGWLASNGSARESKSLRDCFGGMPAAVWLYFAPGADLDLSEDVQDRGDEEVELLPRVPMTPALAQKTGIADTSVAFNYLNDIGPRMQPDGSTKCEPYSFAEIAAIIREHIAIRKQTEQTEEADSSAT